MWQVKTLIQGEWLQAACSLVRNSDVNILVDTGATQDSDILVSALKEVRLCPNDIHIVLNTHLHFDHASNNHLFEKAKIFMSRAEYEWAIALDRDLRGGEDLKDVVLKYYPELPSYNFSWAKIKKIIGIARLLWSESSLGAADQFNWLEDARLPAGISVLSTPGHTPFHFSYVIDTQPVATLIAGDAFLSRNLEDKDILTMIPNDRQRFDESKASIETFRGWIVPGHGAPFSNT
jgi:glyoxylase-like metal-dependent hydrolase (beta-lactamase superfamily II)